MERGLFLGCKLGRLALLGGLLLSPAGAQQRTTPPNGQIPGSQFPGSPIANPLQLPPDPYSEKLERQAQARSVLDRYHKMQKDSNKLVAIAGALKKDEGQKPSAAELDRELAQVAKLSHEVQELMRQE